MTEPTQSSGNGPSSSLPPPEAREQRAAAVEAVDARRPDQHRASRHGGRYYVGSGAEGKAARRAAGTCRLRRSRACRAGDYGGRRGPLGHDSVPRGRTRARRRAARKRLRARGPQLPPGGVCRFGVSADPAAMMGGGLCGSTTTTTAGSTCSWSTRIRTGRRALGSGGGLPEARSTATGMETSRT